MTGKIYLETAAGLVAMTEAKYDAEAILQGLLAEHPDLLAGEQMNLETPRRWLLMSRELGVPDQAGGRDRWSLDHLFVDQEGIPTLVEVKRSSDTRLRREVVGQLLDYAANVAAYWPASEARHIFEERCDREGADPVNILRLFLEVSSTADASELSESTEAFWQSVSTNLAARRMRLVFVADVIPRELQRIVEFLNESMVRTEVFAVEVKQFVSADLITRTFVPRVIGQTAAADDLKRSASTATPPPLDTPRDDSLNGWPQHRPPPNRGATASSRTHTR